MLLLSFGGLFWWVGLGVVWRFLVFVFFVVVVCGFFCCVLGFFFVGISQNFSGAFPILGTHVEKRFLLFIKPPPISVMAR